MSNLPSRNRLRQAIPRPIVRNAGRIRRYGERLLIWYKILRQLSGVTKRDRRVLRRSALQSIARSARQLDDWQNPQIDEGVDIDVPGVGRFHARARCDDLYHLLPFREGALFDCIRGNLGPGMVFVDAGANIGVFTILAARLVGPEGHVHAFEMMPDTAEALRRHVALNGLTNVTLVERALWHEDRIESRAGHPDGKFGMAALCAPGAVQSGDTVGVRTVRLDTALCDETRPIAMMKMDIEGAELQALRGAPRILKRTSMIIFEDQGIDQSVADFLRSMDFDISRLDGKNSLARSRSIPPRVG